LIDRFALAGVLLQAVLTMQQVLSAADLASKIDHTILKPEATSAEVDKVVAEALEYHFAAVCVAPRWVSRVAEKLRGSGVRTCTVAGFPHGTSKAVLKAIEATSAIKDGADEVDVVAFLPALADGNLEAAKAELLEFAKAARATRKEVVLKVIVESACLLSLGADKGERAIDIACRAVRESGCDFIKTSTGFHPSGGASVQAVQLMKKYGQSLRIKASGGIRDLATAQAMLDAGADRLGMSASVAVVEGMRKA
jgi:deoxyribose-phosphate aldolase